MEFKKSVFIKASTDDYLKLLHKYVWLDDEDKSTWLFTHYGNYLQSSILEFYLIAFGKRFEMYKFIKDEESTKLSFFGDTYLIKEIQYNESDAMMYLEDIETNKLHYFPGMNNWSMD
jgi:hypothetical protein